MEGIAHSFGRSSGSMTKEFAHGDSTIVVRLKMFFSWGAGGLFSRLANQQGSTGNGRVSWYMYAAQVKVHTRENHADDAEKHLPHPTAYNHLQPIHQICYNHVFVFVSLWLFFYKIFVKFQCNDQ